MHFSTESLVRGNRACNYSSVVAITFTLYDWISVAEEEVTQIWMRPWSKLKYLYVFIRVVSFGAQIFPIIIFLQPSAVDSSAPFSVWNCRWINGFQGASSLLLMMVVQVVLLLRVEALYQNRHLKYLLRALYIGEFITTAVMFLIEMHKVQFGLHCVTIKFPTQLMPPYFLLPVVVELIFFTFTMIKFYEAVRDGWGQQSFIFRFLQDGIWAFALPLVTITVNTVCITVLPGQFSSIAFSWTIAIPGFAGCRLILNMSHLLRRFSHTEDPITYPDQDFQLDTELVYGASIREVYSSTQSVS